MSSLTSETTTVVTTTPIVTTTPPPTATNAPTTTPSTTPAAVTTTTPPPSTSITSVSPTSTTVVNSTTIVTNTSIIAITSTITQSPSVPTLPPTVITITSTQAVVTTPGISTSSTRSTSSSTSSSATPSILSASGNSVASKGLSSGATIAIAVIIPIFAVAAAIIFGILFWRRRRNRKDAEEQRKNEMAEYGFNPNSDPTLPVGVAAYTDGGSEANDDSGYRGWGATTVSNRKTSTNLGSNSRAAALNGTALSDGGSQSGAYAHPSPSAGAGSDGTQEPLMQGQHEMAVPAAVTGGAVAGAAVTGASLAALNSHSARNQRFSSSIHRGPSNASSAYSAGGALSEVSSEHNPMPGPYIYHEEVPYNVYNEGQNPYGDGAHNAETPVIRDVQARRNTRIERAPTFPQQGGIAQNF